MKSFIALWVYSKMKNLYRKGREGSQRFAKEGETLSVLLRGPLRTFASFAVNNSARSDHTGKTEPCHG
jgi:hypothetical protein